MERGGYVYRSSILIGLYLFGRYPDDFAIFRNGDWIPCEFMLQQRMLHGAFEDFSNRFPMFDQ
jgi:hypothetical protein